MILLCVKECDDLKSAFDFMCVCHKKIPHLQYVKIVMASSEIELGELGEDNSVLFSNVRDKVNPPLALASRH